MLALLDGVIGKGTANSRSFLVGDVALDGLGEEGVARIERAEGDFGEEEASSRVSAEGFVGAGKGGSRESGILGIAIVSLCN